VLCVALFAAQQPHPWTTLATALALSAASAVSGLLLGFVFGVPRVLAADRPRSTGTGGGIAANTNLEQISDWLTKILVGVGLTQFAAIIGGARRLFSAVGPRSVVVPARPHSPVD
jgi:hypothetical protein